jgi:hypothetical protein
MMLWLANKQVEKSKACFVDCVSYLGGEHHKE